ncbi:hypothetical protein NCLIV_033910 [Neospora caninum Liverpool]|uniref:WD domain, G-beta repeat-containing protein n=1 Tax=Neospora caninum (strain Liverpool) TaxID=572307 RepID=F0VIP3_NEOCL|nr:hypothetical protein NCLIV_033910 [Neospora caninum Liverpool]CBZ53604.1 hypothetical protein NCLIV_033910 [Neospora caninum Liverpool]CEL67594.1 TPA: WD domain, G-beta repeat-containing protein [Neospora caninum Liverpool]|eukprot:XP_003883636.1 hypothetical protein NCLIV_033910 [Neospora caninum Liverpool]
MSGGGVPPPAAPSLRSSFSPDHHLWLSSLIWPDIPLQASISCVAVNPRFTILATGTHTGHIYVWQLNAVHAALACPESRVCRLGSNALPLAAEPHPPAATNKCRGRPTPSASGGTLAAAGAHRGDVEGREDDAQAREDATQRDVSGEGNAHVRQLPLSSRRGEAAAPGDLPAESTPGCCAGTSTPPSGASCEEGGTRFEAPLPLVPHLILISEWGGSAPLIECVFAVAAAPLVSACSEEVLVSIHSDSKLRVWSLLDGRCLSATKQFPYPLLSIRVLSDRRYVVLTGKTGAMVFDLWTHCRVCHLSLSLPPVSPPSTVFRRLHHEAALQPSPGSWAPDSAGAPGGAGELAARGRRERARHAHREAETPVSESWPFLRLTATATNPPPDCSEDGLERLRALFPNLGADLPRFPLASPQGEPGRGREGTDSTVAFRSSDGHAFNPSPVDKRFPDGLPPHPSASLSSSSSFSSSPVALFHQQSKPVPASEHAARGDSFSFLALQQETSSSDDLASLPAFPRLDTAPRHLATQEAGNRAQGIAPLWPSDSFANAPEGASEPNLLPPFLEQPVTVAGLTPEGRLAVWDLQVVLATWEEQQTQLDGLGGSAMFHGKREQTVFRSLVFQDTASSARRRQPAGVSHGRSRPDGETHPGEEMAVKDRNAAPPVSAGLATGTGAARGKGGVSEAPLHSNSATGRRDQFAGDTAGDAAKDKKKRDKTGAGVSEGAAAVLQPMRTMFGGMFGVGGDDESEDEGDDETEETKGATGIEPVFVSSVCCEPSEVPEVGGSGASSLLSVTASFLVALSSDRLVVWRRLPRVCGVSLASPSPLSSIAYDLFLDVPAPSLASSRVPSFAGLLAADSRAAGEDSRRRSSTCREEEDSEAKGQVAQSQETLALWSAAAFGDTGHEQSFPGLPWGWSGMHLLPYSRDVSRFCEQLGALAQQHPFEDPRARERSERSETEGALHVWGRESATAAESRSSMERGAVYNPSCENVEAVLLAWTADGTLRAFLLPLGANISPSLPSPLRASGSRRESSDAGEMHIGARRGPRDRPGPSAGLADIAALTQGLLIGQLPDELLGGEDTPTPVFLPLFAHFSFASLATAGVPAEDTCGKAARSCEPSAASALTPPRGRERGGEAGRRGEARTEAPRSTETMQAIVGGLLCVGVSLEASDRVAVASWALEASVESTCGGGGRPLGFREASEKSWSLSLQREGTGELLAPDAFAKTPESEAMGPLLSAPASVQPTPSPVSGAHPPPSSSPSPAFSVLRLHFSLRPSISVGELWLLPSTLRSSLHRTLFPPVPSVLDSCGEETTPSLTSRRRPRGGCLSGARAREFVDTGVALRTQFWRLAASLDQRKHLRQGQEILVCLGDPERRGEARGRGQDVGETTSAGGHLPSLPWCRSQTGVQPSSPEPRDTTGQCTYTADRHILSWCLVESQGRVFLICSASDGAALGLCLNHVAARLRLHRHLYGEASRQMTATAAKACEGPSASGAWMKPATSSCELACHAPMQKGGDARQGTSTEGLLYLSGSPDLVLWPKACHQLPSLVHLPTPATHPGLVAAVEARGECRRLREKGARKTRGPFRATLRPSRERGDSASGRDGSFDGEREAALWGGAARSPRGSPLRSLSGGAASCGGSTRPPAVEDLDEDAFSCFSSEFSSQEFSSDETFPELANEASSAYPSTSSSSSLSSSDEEDSPGVSPRASPAVCASSLSSRFGSTRRCVPPPSRMSVQPRTPLYASPPDAVKTQVTHFCSLSSVLLAGGTSRGDILFWRLPSFSVCGYLPRALPAPVCAMLRVLSVCGGQGEAQFDSNCFLVADATAQLTLVDAAKCCGCTDTSSANPPDTELHTVSARHQKTEGAAEPRRGMPGSANGPSTDPANHAKHAEGAAQSATGSRLGEEVGRAPWDADRDRQRMQHHELAVPREQRTHASVRPDEHGSSTSNLSPGLAPAMSEKGLVESPMYVHYRASTWSVRTPELLQAVPRPCNWSGVFPLERPESAPRCVHSGPRSPCPTAGFAGTLEGGFSHASSLVAPHAIRKVAVDLLSDTICCITVSARFFLWKIQTGQLLKEGPLSRISGVFAPDVPNADLFYSRTFLQNPHLYSSSPHLEMTVWGFALGHLQLASSSCCRCCHFACPCSCASSAVSSPRRQRLATQEARGTATGLEAKKTEAKDSEVVACASESREQSAGQETPLDDGLPSPRAVPSSFASESPSTLPSSDAAAERRPSRPRRRESRDEKDHRARRQAWTSLCCHASAKRSFEAHRTLPSAAVLLLPVSQFLQPCYPPRVALPAGASPGAPADRASGLGTDGGSKGPAGTGSTRGVDAPLAAHALALCSAFLPFGVNASVDAGLQELFGFLSPSPLPLVPGVIGADLAISFSLPLLLIHGLLHDSYVRHALRSAEKHARVPGPSILAANAGSPWLGLEGASPCCHQPSLPHNLHLHRRAAQRYEVCKMETEHREPSSLPRSASSSSSNLGSGLTASRRVTAAVERKCVERFTFFASALAERDAVGTLHAASEAARGPAFPDAMSAVAACVIQREQRSQLRKAGCSPAASPAASAIQQRLWRLHKLPGLCKSPAALKALLAAGPPASLISLTPPSAPSQPLALSGTRGSEEHPSGPRTLSCVDLLVSSTCDALDLSGLPSIACKSAGALRVSAASPFCFSSATALSLTSSFLAPDATGGMGLGGRRDSRGALGYPSQGGFSGRPGGYVFGLFLASSTSAFLSACVRSPAAACRAAEGARARLLQALDETQSGGAVGTTARQLQIQIQHHQKVLYHHLHLLQSQQKRLEARMRQEREADGASKSVADEPDFPKTHGPEAGKQETHPASDNQDAAASSALAASSCASYVSSLGKHISQLQAQQAAIRHQLISLQQQLIALADGEHWGDEGRADGARRLIRGRERLVHVSLCVATAPWPTLVDVRRFCDARDARGSRGGPGISALALVNGAESAQEGSKVVPENASSSRPVASPPPSTFSSLTSSFSSLSSLSSLASSPSTPPSSGAADSDAHADASHLFRLILSLRQEERAVWLRPGPLSSRPRFGLSGTGGASGRDEGLRQRGSAGFGSSEPRQPAVAFIPSAGRLPLAIGGWPLPRFALYKDTVLSSPPCAEFLRLSGASLASPHVSAGTSLAFLALLSAALVPTLTPPPPSVGARAALIQAFSDTFCLSFFRAAPATSSAGVPRPVRAGFGAAGIRGGGVSEALACRHLPSGGAARSEFRLASAEASNTQDPREGRARQRLALAAETGREKGATAGRVPTSLTPFPLDPGSSLPSAPLPSLWLLTHCFLHNCPSPCHASHHSPAASAAAASRAAVYVHFGACHLLRRTICAMEETQLLPFVDVCLQFLGGNCAHAQATAENEGPPGAEETGVAALPPSLAEELDCAGQSAVALVLLAIILYERPGLCKIAGLNIGTIVGHQLACTFLGALLPLAASGPSASVGGFVSHSSSPGVGSHSSGGVQSVRAELLMELFALGLGIVWDCACLFSRAISALLDDYVPRSLTAKLSTNNGTGTEALLPDELLLCQLMAAMFAFTLRPQWSACSSLILTRLARTNVPLFVKVLGRAAGTVEFGSEYTAAALLTLVQFSARIPELSLEHLPDIVEAVVRCLDPAEPHLRRRALNAATAALFHLVRCFPMATFHQQTQRFAVGCADGLIILYDLRTATKWKVLEGHTGAVNCLSFSDDGSLLASYSSADCTMRLWQSSSSGFFGGILGISAKSQKVIQLPPCPKNIFWQSIPYQLETVRMVNKSKTEWMIRREDGKGYMVLVS